MQITVAGDIRTIKYGPNAESIDNAHQNVTF